jgi:hypothetical protein
MFDNLVFKKRFGEHFLISGMECLGVWALASNIFVAKVRKHAGEKWVNYFYYDTSETHFRNVLDMPTAKTQTEAINIDIVAITGDDADKVRVCFVDDEEPVFDAFDFAKNLFAANKGQEILWLSEPCSLRHF